MASFGDRVPRCNLCSRLFREGTVNGDYCVCGGSAWFLSSLTIPERLAYAIGIFKQCDMSILNAYHGPLGGELSMVEAAHIAATEKANG